MFDAFSCIGQENQGPVVSHFFVFDLSDIHNMQAMRSSWSFTLLGALVGGAGGWAYWYFFGCTNGCAITSSPVNSTIYGALMGGLLFNSFKRTDPGHDTTGNTNP